MSKIFTATSAAVASLALGAGIAASAGAAPAQASVCGTTSVYCSMEHARHSTQADSRGIRELQLALRNVHVSVRVTGTMDAQTRSALRQYQASRGIAQTGRLDGRTAAYLRAGAGARHTAHRTSSVHVSTGVSSTASRAVAYAYAHQGRAYVYGATGPNTFDCSGLMQAAYRAAGKSIPRTSYAQLGAYQRVSLSALRPGDIVGFYGGEHVGMYIGHGTVIHAPHTGTVVKQASMYSMPIAWAVRPA